MQNDRRLVGGRRIAQTLNVFGVLAMTQWEGARSQQHG